MQLKKISVFVMAVSIGLSGICLAEIGVECKADDNLIVKDIKYRISIDSLASNSRVTVRSKNCVVTLAGNAKTNNEASRVIEIAASTPGVVDINTNNFHIINNNKQPFTDSYITAKVKGMFMREKVFGDHSISVMGIHVETKDGVVSLTGTATEEQAKQAADLAQTVEGVKKVESAIKVQ